MSGGYDVLEPGSVTGEQLREHVRQMAKRFKQSWVEMARVLYSVYKDKRYKEWGFDKFETYVKTEIGIRKLTALKLLRSYSFLEREEPVYLKKDYAENSEAAKIPDYEAVDVLRKAKNRKEIDGNDYASLKEKVFLQGKDAAEVRKDLATLIQQREELSPEEAWVRRKEVNIKRFLSTLKSLKRDMEETKMIPGPLLEEITRLIDRLDVELK